MTAEQKNTAKQWQAKYGPWAVVTGASDGIGREMARTIAQSKLNVVLVARRQAVLDLIAAELADDYGIETRVIAADLSQPDAVDRVIAATANLPVGLFVASAGFGTSGPFLDNALTDELSLLDVNCRAVLAMTHAFAHRFVQQGRGGIVLLSSILAFQGVPRSANYAATKAYIQSLAEGLALELAPHGVDVIASAPGPIHSGFAARANMQMGFALKPDAVAQATLAALGRQTTIIPGWFSKVLAYSLATMPRWGRTRVLQQVMTDMTKHQPEARHESA